jgi:hypothetical protein
MPLFNGYGEVQHKGMICLKTIVLETKRIHIRRYFRDSQIAFIV